MELKEWSQVFILGVLSKEKLIMQCTKRLCKKSSFYNIQFLFAVRVSDYCIYVENRQKKAVESPFSQRQIRYPIRFDIEVTS